MLVQDESRATELHGPRALGLRVGGLFSERLCGRSQLDREVAICGDSDLERSAGNFGRRGIVRGVHFGDTAGIARCDARSRMRVKCGRGGLQ